MRDGVYDCEVLNCIDGKLATGHVFVEMGYDAETVLILKVILIA